jgi:hypothetical protein
MEDISSALREIPKKQQFESVKLFYCKTKVTVHQEE